MKKMALLLALVLCLSVFAACGQREKTYTAEDVAGKIYTYEKDGFGGPFSISIYEDGRFSYYVGFLSSYIGFGEWSVEDGVLTLTDNTGLDFVNRFLIGEDALTFLEEGSTDFMYMNVEDGDRFFGEPFPTLPTIEEVREIIMTGQEGSAFENEVLELLRSFTCDDLVQAWGEPDDMTSGIWSFAWDLDETSAIWVVFDSDGYASEVRLWTKD